MLVRIGALSDKKIMNKKLLGNGIKCIDADGEPGIPDMFEFGFDMKVGNVLTKEGNVLEESGALRENRNLKIEAECEIKIQKMSTNVGLYLHVALHPDIVDFVKSAVFIDEIYTGQTTKPFINMVLRKSITLEELKSLNLFRISLHK